MRLPVLAMIAVISLASASRVWAEDHAAEAGGGAASKTSDDTAKKAPFATGAPGMGAAGLMGGNWYIGYVGRVVTLTDEQKKAMTDIVEARERAVKDFQAKNAAKIKAAGSAVRESLAARDRDAIAKAQRAYLQLFAPMHQLMKSSQDELTDVLTAEQKDQLHDYRVMHAIKSMTAPIALSSEQIDEVKAASTGDDLGAFGGKTYQAVQRVLTPEQKAEIAKSRAVHYAKFAFARAKLTADQIKQVEALGDELAKDQTAASNNAKVYAKLTDRINELLTDEQKEAMKKARKSWRGPGTNAPRASAAVDPDDDFMEMPDE
jgi:hypothetical protein